MNNKQIIHTILIISTVFIMAPRCKIPDMSTPKAPDTVKPTPDTPNSIADETPAIRHVESEPATFTKFQPYDGEIAPLEGEEIYISKLPQPKLSFRTTSNYRLNKPQFISFFPKNDYEYELIYGKKPTYSSTIEVDNFNNKLAEEDSLIKTNNLTNEEQFFNALKDSQGNPIVILAHSNKRGEQVVFPNGTNINITKLHKKCEEVKKRCLVLTCHGKDFEIINEITPNDAFKMWKGAKQSYLDKKINKIDDFILTARKERQNQINKKRINISWATTTSASILIYLSQQDDD